MERLPDLAECLAIGPAEAAKAMNCSLSLVRRMCRNGQLSAYRITSAKRGHWRIPIRALHAWITRMAPEQLAARVATAARWPKRDAAYWRSYWEHERDDEG